ncbi:MAG TPA: hypothetical protein VGK90_08110 [Rhizomicrobium sp.]|jgi:hypothetical protein
MDSLTKTLLTGAAVSAFAVAPAVAGQAHGPRLAMLTNHGVVALKGTVHSKTVVKTPGTTKITSVFTYTTRGGFGSQGGGKTWQDAGNETALYKQTAALTGAVIFYTVTAGGHCADAPDQKAKITGKPTNGKGSVYSTKVFASIPGTCTGTLTYYGPAYELKSKTATSDNEGFTDTAKDTVTTTTTGTKHKHNKFKFTDEINIFAHITINH